VGNFGPGFDTLSLALGPLGDSVRLRDGAADEVRVEGPHAQGISTDWQKNVVGAVLDYLRSATKQDVRFRVDLTKGVPAGSGLGSSASSSAAAAVAFAKATGPIPRALLFQACVEGEARVSGPHRDDAAAATFGGLAIVDPDSWSCIAVPPPTSLRLAVVRPHVELPTRRMREVLPRSVPLADAVRNMSGTAQVVEAFIRGDIDALARAMRDAIATPSRSELIPGFSLARSAAAATGALGFAISGSGPSMFAIAAGEPKAREVASAMAEAVRGAGIGADAIVGVPAGVRNLSTIVH
jgi:homoserine kinase